MGSPSNDDTAKLVLEAMDDKFAIFLENVESIIDKRLAPIANDTTELKTDMKIVKAAVTDTNKQVQDHENRITRLESQAV